MDEIDCSDESIIGCRKRGSRLRILSSYSEELNNESCNWEENNLSHDSSTKEFSEMYSEFCEKGDR